MLIILSLNIKNPPLKHALNNRTGALHIATLSHLTQLYKLLSDNTNKIRIITIVVVPLDRVRGYDYYD